MTPPTAGAGTQTLSVVVASNRPWPLVEATLVSLGPECRETNAELILVRAASADERAELAARYPLVRLVEAPVDASIPLLRGLGLEAAEGTLVLNTEDHCLADQGWLRQLAAASDERTVVGGAMANASGGSVVNEGAFFSEYGFFAGPAEGPPLLTGANVGYPRSALPQVTAWALGGEWENVIHARLAAEGYRLRFVPEARVLHNGRYTLAGFCRDRYEHGYEFARRRLAEDRRPHRWARFASTPLLPLVLLGRVSRAVGGWRRPGFLRALPVTWLFLAAWAAGEAAGYWAGPLPAGDPA